ncbi:40S ribosomal protein S27-like protein [Tupaia chinensis]|uniref:40S ribosomal protein S27-like protein n=1 Tax=Tupaia chinensis TaxID=246437 RepID=L9LAN5_TUPCH|nr:40S ribosomal protein S27-like protein [Tupaia chinensis]
MSNFGEEEKRKHKKKRLVQSPNSYFMGEDAQNAKKSPQSRAMHRRYGCSTVLCQSTGGKARLTERRSLRRKQHRKHLDSR